MEKRNGESVDSQWELLRIEQINFAPYPFCFVPLVERGDAIIGFPQFAGDVDLRLFQGLMLVWSAGRPLASSVSQGAI